MIGREHWRRRVYVNQRWFDECRKRGLLSSLARLVEPPEFIDSTWHLCEGVEFRDGDVILDLVGYGRRRGTESSPVNDLAGKPETPELHKRKDPPSEQRPSWVGTPSGHTVRHRVKEPPSDRWTCSLETANPPWMLTWPGSYKPFSEMRITPTMSNYHGYEYIYGSRRAQSV